MAAAVDCILKLGGSALTQKNQLETLKAESLRRAAALISKLWEAGERRCIIVHGAGYTFRVLKIWATNGEKKGESPSGTTETAGERLLEIRQQHEGFVRHNGSKAQKKQLHAQIVTLLTMH
ncbi:hypothetical protein E2320_009854 [Naja naja]|nr:hypothetical protein E2320_009854 [Naja naja]